MKSGIEGKVVVDWPLSSSLFTSCQLANQRKVEHGGTRPSAVGTWQVGNNESN